MSKPLRVGVVGVGGIAQMMHLPTLAERPDLFEMVAFADVSTETLEAVGRRYGVRNLSASHRDIARREDVDAVLVLSGGSHREAAVAALEAGKHLFVEKPLGYSVAETETIAAVADKSSGVVMVGYHKRYDPAVRKAMEAVRAMRDLRYVEVTVLHPDDSDYREHHSILPLRDAPRVRTPEEDGNRRALAKVSEGPIAALVDQIAGDGAPPPVRVASCIATESLLHDLNLVRGFLGEPERVVSGHVWRGGFAQHSLTRFPNDVCVSASWVSVPGLRNYEETVRFIGNDERVTLVFPSPYLRHFPTPLTIERMAGDALVRESWTVSYEEAFRAELLEFSSAIRDNRAPETSIADAMGDARWLRALAAAYRAG